jgi:hypothetical protein
MLKPTSFRKLLSITFEEVPVVSMVLFVSIDLDSERAAIGWRTEDSHDELGDSRELELNSGWRHHLNIAGSRRAYL